MSVRLREVLIGQLDALRHEPTDARIRGMVGEQTVVDSTRALLVWEPKRIVPTYAVPPDDVAGDLVAASADPARPEREPRRGDRVVYDPSIPFSVHTTAGEPLLVRVRGVDRAVDAFRPADADLAGHVLLDFRGFDAWYVEDELNVSHPRDPFHRVDIVHSSRPVRVEIAGTVLAETTSAVFLFEPPLPTRYYVPFDDVRSELLEPSERVTYCAYKGQASYFSAAGEPSVAWGYREPLRDASEITGRIAFFNERVDIFVDGVKQDQPITPWSKRD